MTAPNDEIVCKELVELVTPYLEDVLPANERAAIERQTVPRSGRQVLPHGGHAHSPKSEAITRAAKVELGISCSL